MTWHFIFTLGTLLLIVANAAAERFPYYPEGEQYVFRGRVLDGQTCEPVSGIDVFVDDKTFTTDVEGLFVAPLGDGISWFSHVYAQRGTQVSQRVTILYARDLFCELELGPPATLTGTVTGPSGEPVSGARIRVKQPRTQGPPLLAMVTDDEGRYFATDVVPGPVSLFLEHEAYYLERECQCNEPLSLSLLPGDTTVRDLSVKELSWYSGHTIGPDGTPAPYVNLRYARDGYSSTTIWSDASGGFSFRARPKYGISASHPQFGTGYLNLPEPDDSEATDEVRIPLNGRVRITGIVRNPAGEPVPDVLVQGGGTHLMTDESGHFTLDALSLSEKGSTGEIRFAPPAWVDPSVFPQIPVEFSPWFTVPETTRTLPSDLYNNETTMSAKGSHGDTIDLEVTLEALPTYTLQGVLRDGNGEPVADMPVLIYEGVANRDQWLSDGIAVVPSPPPPWPMRPQSTIDFGERPAALKTRAHTDATGNWQAGVVLGRKRADWIGRDHANPRQLTIVTGTPTMTKLALVRKTLDEDTRDLEVNLQLAPAPDDILMRVHVVDDSGRPIVGSSWTVEGRGPFTSDDGGILTIPRFRDRIRMKRMDSDGCILAAEVTGTIEAVAPSTLDYYDESLAQQLFVSFRGSMSGKGISEEQPHVYRDDTAVHVNFFDTHKGGLTIVLGPCPE